MNQNIPTGKETAGAHKPFWIASSESIKYSPLAENTQTDVIIIGGGLAGVSVAYCLCKIGKRVVLVEDGYIGSGETGRTTAHLASALDDRFYELEKVFGEEITKLAAQSHAQAIDFIEKTCISENIDCDFKRTDGYLFLDPSDHISSIEKEYEAATRAGLTVEKTTQIPGLLVQPGLSLKFSNQAQFHPMKYVKGLCDAIIRLGGKIYTETRATEISESGIITQNGYKVLADAVVVATNAPISSKFILPLKQFAYRTYAIGGLIAKGSLPNCLWWDTGNYNIDSDQPPYHYVRTENYDDKHDLLIVGGEDHSTGLADAEHVLEEERYDALETWARKLFPMQEIKYRWSGQVMEPIDLLGYIGKNPGSDSNIYIVSGDSGHGMTHATIAGILITDMLTGKENPWKKIYNPSRNNILRKGITWLKELLSTSFVDYLKTNPSNTDASKVHDLKPGEGTIIKLVDGNKYGAFRDEQDMLHLVSAKCTHLGCTIKWNNDEKTWDCPCHGSRFAYNGEVINGPANDPLDYHKESNMAFKKNLD